MVVRHAVFSRSLYLCILCRSCVAAPAATAYIPPAPRHLRHTAATALLVEVIGTKTAYMRFFGRTISQGREYCVFFRQETDSGIKAVTSSVRRAFGCAGSCCGASPLASARSGLPAASFVPLRCAAELICCGPLPFERHGWRYAPQQPARRCFCVAALYVTSLNFSVKAGSRDMECGVSPRFRHGFQFFGKMCES